MGSNATRARSVGVSAARSNQQGHCESHEHQPQHSEGLSADDHDQDGRLFPGRNGRQNYHGPTAVMGSSFCASRSEEHTSELQSRLHLVCRLLLEKKKKKRLEVGRYVTYSRQDWLQCSRYCSID